MPNEVRTESGNIHFIEVESSEGIGWSCFYCGEPITVGPEKIIKGRLHDNYFRLDKECLKSLISTLEILNAIIDDNEVEHVGGKIN